MGERITQWLAAHPELQLVDRVLTQMPGRTTPRALGLQGKPWAAAYAYSVSTARRRLTPDRLDVLRKGTTHQTSTHPKQFRVLSTQTTVFTRRDRARHETVSGATAAFGPSRHSMEPHSGALFEFVIQLGARSHASWTRRISSSTSPGVPEDANALLSARDLLRREDQHLAAPSTKRFHCVAQRRVVELRDHPDVVHQPALDPHALDGPPP